MMLVMIILAALSLGMVLYAVFGIFSPVKSEASKNKKNEPPLLPALDPGKEQKIQRLQSQIVELESQLEKNKAGYAQGATALTVAQENALKLSDELKRREEWVAKAEAELLKVKSENADLSSKSVTKEKELQEEFTKNVNFSRQLGELKLSLEAKEIACRLKEDQLQAQKYQIEEQLKSLKEHLATIAELNRKEKISEWVPKAEFNKLNEEYSQLEKEWEATQARLKSFAAEIAYLRQEVKPVAEIKLIEKPSAMEETRPVGQVNPPGEIPREAGPEEQSEPKIEGE